MARKEPNPSPPKISKSVTFRRMAMIFDEWNRRYAEDMEGFGSSLNEDGSPDLSYGESAAKTFYGIAAEMDSKKLLPKP